MTARHKVTGTSCITGTGVSPSSGSLLSNHQLANRSVYYGMSSAIALLA